MNVRASRIAACRTTRHHDGVTRRGANASGGVAEQIREPAVVRETLLGRAVREVANQSHSHARARTHDEGPPERAFAGPKGDLEEGLVRFAPLLSGRGSGLSGRGSVAQP